MLILEIKSQIQAREIIGPPEMKAILGQILAKIVIFSKYMSLFERTNTFWVFSIYLFIGMGYNMTMNIDLWSIYAPSMINSKFDFFRYCAIFFG